MSTFGGDCLEIPLCSKRSAITFENKRYTYGELMGKVKVYAKYLSLQGCKKGDKVGLYIIDPIEWIVSSLSLLSIGCSIYCIENEISCFNMMQIVNDSHIDYVIVDKSLNVEINSTIIYIDEKNRPNSYSSVQTTHLSLNSLYINVLFPSDDGYREWEAIKLDVFLDCYKFMKEKLNFTFSESIFYFQYSSDLNSFIWLAVLVYGGELILCNTEATQSENIYFHDFEVLCPLRSIPQFADVWKRKEKKLLPKKILSFGEDLIDVVEERERWRNCGIQWFNFFSFPRLMFVSSLKKRNDGVIYHEGKPISGIQATVMNRAGTIKPIGQVGQLYMFENQFKQERRIKKTNYFARQLTNGRFELILEKSQIFFRNGQYGSIKEFERILLESLSIKEVAVKKCQNELRVYWIINQNESEKGLYKFLKDKLPICYFPFRYSRTNYIPRNRFGEVNWEDLEERSLIDSQSLAEIEKSMPNVKLEATYRRKSSNLPYPILKEPEMKYNSQILDSKELSILHGGEMTLNKDVKSLADILDRAAKTKNKVIYIDEVGKEIELTYEELLNSAQRIAGGLKEKGIQKNDYVLFQISSYIDCIKLFWGCIWRGAIPCPLDIHSTENINNDFLEIWKGLKEPIIVTDSNRKDELLNRNSIFFLTPKLITTVKELESNVPIDKMMGIVSEDTAVMMFTSGSTGLPKGVKLSHENIIARSQGSEMYNEFSKDEVTLNWMPLTHVGGLIYFHIRDIYLTCTQIQVKTELFIKEPVLWLACMDRYKVTITWAPNFAFHMLITNGDKLKTKLWDLSACHSLLNGGEMIHPETAKSVIEMLTEFGLSNSAFRPVYGMCETTSGITYSNGLQIETIGNRINEMYVSVGHPIPGVSCRIVDDSNQVVTEGNIGHLQVCGYTITKGYYGDSNAPLTKFTKDEWFTTGDLGFVKNRNLYIVGREKDVIIVGASKYICQQIESAIGSLSGIDASSCTVTMVDRLKDRERFAVFYHPEESPQTGFLEWINQSKHKIDDLHQQINRKILEVCGAQPNWIIPLPMSQFPKTSIGKIKRKVLKHKFIEGEMSDYSLFKDNSDIRVELPNWFYCKKWVETLLSNSVPIVEKQDLAVIGNRKMITTSTVEKLRKNFHITFFSIDELYYQEKRNEIEKIGNVICFLKSVELETDKLTKAQLNNHLSCYMLPICSFLEKVKLKSFYLIIGNSYVLDEKDKFTLVNGYIHGILRSFFLENPFVQGRIIDIDKKSLSDIADIVLQECSVSVRDKEVAYRNGKRYVMKFFQQTEYTAESYGNELIGKNKLYVVTGGIGEVGYEISRWLIQQMNAKILIIGRNQIDNSKRNRLLSLRKLTPYVHYVFGDITDGDFLENEIQHIECIWNTELAAIYHIAGNLSISGRDKHWKNIYQHFVNNESIDSFEEVMESKVFGTLALTQLRKEIGKNVPCVLFGSVTGHFGGVSLGAYAGAHSFMETYSRFKQLKGEKIYYIAWSSWKDLGLSSGLPQAYKTSGRKKNFDSISVKEGIASLLYILMNKWNNIYVGLNESLEDIYIGEKESIQRCLDIHVEENSDKNYEKKLGEALTKHHIHQRFDVIRLITKNDTDTVIMHKEKEVVTDQLERKLLLIWCQVLGRKTLKTTDNFFENGGSSILVPKVIYEIQKQLKIELPIQSIIEAPTVKGLAKLIKREEKDTSLLKIHQMYKETELPSNLKKVLLDKKNSIKNIKKNTIFLTGVTGFVGVFLLQELLRNTKEHIYCLIKGKSKEEAYQRLKDQCDKFKIMLDKKRISVVVGNLADRNLGMNQQEYQFMLTEIDSIYHCGAKVNFSVPYEVLKGPNVNGTLEILLFAARKKMKPVHYVSTLSVFHYYTFKGINLFEHSSIDTKKTFVNGYNQSKWVAERIVQQARELGHPCTIYRLGTVVGNSINGQCQERDFFWLLIKAITTLKVAPDISIGFHLVSVDEVAKAICSLALYSDKKQNNNNYHIVKDPISLETAINWMKQLDYDITVIPYKEWLQRLLDFDKNTKCNELSGLLSVLPEGEETVFVQPNFQYEYTRNILKQRDCSLRNVGFEEFLKTVTYFRGIGFLETPILSGRK